MNIPFSPDEDEFILVATRNKVPYAQIARSLNRSREGVRYRQAVLLARDPSDSLPFSEEDGKRLLKARKEGRDWVGIAVDFNRSLSFLQRRFKTLREREREEEKRRKLMAPKDPAPVKALSSDPIDFPVQARNHLVAILSEDPRGFAAYTDTGDKRTALAVKLPLIWKGAN